MQGTPTQRLAQIVLGENLEAFVRSRRDQGTAWRIVARELYETTGGQVDVTYETLRSWYPDRSAETTSVGA